MAKFKVGDRVRVLTGHDMEDFGARDGDTGTVEEDDSECPFVRLDGCREEQVVAFNDEYLEFDVASPIRTVTRREIVPGTYGGVTVERIPFAGIEIKYSGYGNVHNLREAARLFNDIADVLDENEKKEAA